MLGSLPSSDLRTVRVHSLQPVLPVKINTSTMNLPTSAEILARNQILNNARVGYENTALAPLYSGFDAALAARRQWQQWEHQLLRECTQNGTSMVSNAIVATQMNAMAAERGFIGGRTYPTTNLYHLRESNVTFRTPYIQQMQMRPDVYVPYGQNGQLRSLFW